MDRDPGKWPTVALLEWSIGRPAPPPINQIAKGRTKGPSWDNAHQWAAGVEEVIKIVLRKQTFLYISGRFVSFRFVWLGFFWLFGFWPQQWQHAGISETAQSAKSGNKAPHIIYFNRVGSVGKCRRDPSPKAPY